MKNLLSEEIERYRRLSNYNTKLTLTENVEVISEQPSIGTTVRELESALGKNIGQIMKEFKIAGMDAARVTKLLEMDAKSLEREWAKTLQADIKNGFPKGELGPLGKELSKVEFLRRLSNEVKGQGRVLKPSELETLIKDVKADIKSKNNLRASKFNPRVVKPKPPTPEELKIIDNTVIKYPTIKNWDWARLKKWGLGAGLTVAVLYGIYKLTHSDEPPIVTGGVTPSPTPTPGTSRYRNCSGTYKKGCKTSPTGAIGQVQACLGLTQDGRFWVKTQTALELKGFTNGFTDADITKICGKQVPPPPVPTDNNVEDVDGEDPNKI